MSDARPKHAKDLRTSDVRRPRMFGLAALGGAVGATVAIAAEGAPLNEARPIARAHVAVACASCHTGDEPSASSRAMTTSCTACHGGHASTRGGHRALAAKGELGCATCHSQHARAQGITFDDGAVLRWGAGGASDVTKALPSASSIAPGTTVPLVSLAACASCHDVSRASDVVAACVPADVRGKSGAVATTPSGCFDEHVRLGEVSRGASRDVCAPQHTATRFVAWDAARTVARTTAWVPAATPTRSPFAPAFGGAIGALGLVVGGALLDRRRRRAPEPAPLAPPPRKRLPVIDTSTCLGCYACVDACPFDVLAIEKYVAVVVRPDECCGVVLCEQVCPNGSLRMADGPLVPDQPGLDEHLESTDVPGIFVAGDLTGLPLIKNAIQQGTRAIDRLAATMPVRHGRAHDVVIIGAGPAGLSAALRAKEKNLSAVVIEQADLAASIRSFPRDKIVHDPPLHLPVEGELWLKESTKDELLAQWTRIVRMRRLDVRERHRVVDVRRGESGFSVVAESGGERVVFDAARVIVAIGRRGTPRRLDLTVEDGCESRVHRSLADARSFAGKRVLVVGLGDSAMEAAIAIARQPGAKVAIAYRGSRIARGKRKNVSELEALVRRGEIDLRFDTVPTAVGRDGVTLVTTGAGSGAGSESVVEADAVLVMIGGEPAWDLLERIGIQRPRLEGSAADGERSLELDRSPE